MLDRLYVKQLTKPIKTEGVKSNDFVQDWIELDRRCLRYIRDHHVENETTAIGYWNKLQGLYERKNAARKVGLVMQLSRLSTSSPDGTINKDVVINAILNENLRRSNGTEKLDLNDTLVFEKRINNFKKKNKVMQLKSKGKDKKDDKCYYCEKLGHWKSDCYSFKRDHANSTVKSKKNDNNVGIIDHPQDLTVFDEVGNVCYASDEDEWVINSGAPFHVTPHKRFFSSCEFEDFGVAKMGNNGVSQIVAVGDVHLKTKQGHTIILK
ncbi:hypothetical protein LIER_35758 [Lithospermum erythrorhizon]|uniref:CCHC-type domain-containing protein n=1 Tax=Lithospermum erythrorhizon TaxID=34254 RepID=A0AAV3NXG3_LITER